MSLSRRTLFAAAGGLGLGALAAAPAHAAPVKRGGLALGDTAFVDVTAATLWCGTKIDGVPKEAWDIPRPGIDDPSLTNPVDLRAWNANMEDTSTRAWLSGNGVLETQGVMGTRVIVTELHDDWVKVIIPAQPTPRADGTFHGINGYPGWLPACQLVKNPAFGRAFETAPLATVTSVYAWLSNDPLGASRTTELSFNTVLPVLGRRHGAVRVLRPDGDKQWVAASDVVVRAAGVTPQPPTGEQIVETGRKFLGIRYLWAGVSSFGFDCSGFTYTCYRHHGINLHRDSNPQRNLDGVPVESEVFTGDLAHDEAHHNVSFWQPGDLVFFRSRVKGNGDAYPYSLFVHHVGICATASLTDPVILHSPDSASRVQLEPLSEMLKSRWVVGVRRVL